MRVFSILLNMLRKIKNRNLKEKPEKKRCDTYLSQMNNAIKEDEFIEIEEHEALKFEINEDAINEEVVYEEVDYEEVVNKKDKEDKVKEYRIEEDQAKGTIEIKLDSNPKEKKRRKKYTAPVECHYNLRKRNRLS
jgi:hypothetical protein